MPPRSFQEIQRELEKLSVALKNSRNHQERVRLLREVKVLIQEADNLMEATDPKFVPNKRKDESNQ